MILTDLPDDILYMINDRIDDILPISLVHTSIYILCKDRLAAERETNKRRYIFFEKCKRPLNNGRCNFYWNAFNSVSSIEECDFLRKKYNHQFGHDNFISRVKYTMKNTTQIPLEIWTQYISSILNK